MKEWTKPEVEELNVGMTMSGFVHGKDEKNFFRDWASEHPDGAHVWGCDKGKCSS